MLQKSWSKLSLCYRRSCWYQTPIRAHQRRKERIFLHTLDMHFMLTSFAYLCISFLYTMHINAMKISWGQCPGHCRSAFLHILSLLHIQACTGFLGIFLIPLWLPNIPGSKLETWISRRRLRPGRLGRQPEDSSQLGLRLTLPFQPEDTSASLVALAQVVCQT